MSIHSDPVELAEEGGVIFARVLDPDDPTGKPRNPLRRRIPVGRVLAPPSMEPYQSPWDSRVICQDIC